MADADSHIFICFSSKDEEAAREVVGFLEAKNIKCWISLRDVLPGHNYQEAIVQAIEAARGVVFLFSEHSSNSGEIKKELSIGASVNVPVFPLRLSPIAPSGALRYELATRQWIDMFPDRQGALAKLAATISMSPDRPPQARNTARQHPADPLTVARKPAAPPTARKRARPRVPIVAPGTQQFEAIRALLARHIGPIAKVFVEKAAREARTPDEFCEQLAAHIATPSDRTAFLQSVRTEIANKL